MKLTRRGLFAALAAAIAGRPVLCRALPVRNWVLRHLRDGKYLYVRAAEIIEPRSLLAWRNVDAETVCNYRGGPNLAGFWGGKFPVGTGETFFMLTRGRISIRFRSGSPSADQRTRAQTRREFYVDE